MKERLTDHIGSLLVKRPGEAFLNAGNLLSLLQQSQEFEERPRVIRGKKRAAPSPAPVQRKRFKKDPSVVSLLESPEVDDEQISVPVYLHTFILQFRHEAVEAEVKRRVIKQQSKVFVSAHESICNENITWIRRMLIKGEGNFGGLLCFCRAVVLLVS